MANTDFKSIDHYIAAQPETSQPVLARVRKTIRNAIPKAEETISYQIPTFKLHGRSVISFAGWAQHFALYPGAALIVALKTELVPYDTSKGTIRFPLFEPIPVKLIERIAKIRANEVAERAKASVDAKKKR
jgi:uncharacterized protein YdhG (YjbR/CyaY superfamily)